MAKVLIIGVDKSRYGTLITELANQYAKGGNKYLDNMVEALYKTQ